MKSVIRFALILVGVGLVVVGWLLSYVAILAELFGELVSSSCGNVAIGITGICISAAGYLLARNMVEDDLTEQD